MAAAVAPSRQRVAHPLPTPHAVSTSSARAKWWPVIPVLVLAALLYAAHLDAIPLNNDEAIYILYASIAAHPHHLGDLFGGFSYAVPPLFMWLGAVALHVHPDPNPVSMMLTIRMLSVLSGLGSIIVLYRLAWRLYGNSSISVIAALLYVFCPYALFFNRIGMLDTFVGFLGLVVAWQSVRVFSQLTPSRRDIVLLGVLLGLGQLAKGTSTFFWLLPVLAWLAFDRRLPGRHLIGRMIACVAVAGTLYLSILLSGDPRNLLRPFFTAVKYSVASSASAATYSLHHFPLLDHIQHNSQNWWSWQTTYMGLMVIALAGVALLGAIARRAAADLYIVVWMVVPWIVMLPVYVYDSRYIVFTIPIEALAAARGLAMLGRLASYLLSARHRSLARAVLGIGTVLAIVAVGRFDAQHDTPLITNAAAADLVPFDRQYYISGWLSGYGIVQVNAYLRAQAQHGPIIVVMDQVHLPYVALAYALAGVPHIQIARSSSTTGLPLSPRLVPPGTRLFAVLNPPKDPVVLAQIAHPTWRPVFQVWKPDHMSEFIIYEQP